MRLLHVSPAYAPFQGGAEMYTQQLSERLVAMGHSVTVVTTQAERPQDFWNGLPSRRAACETLHGVTVLRLPLNGWPPAPWMFHIAHRVAQRISCWANAPSLWLAGGLPRVPRLRAALQHAPACDVIHAVNLHFPALSVAAWREAQRRNIPFLVTPFLHANGSCIYPRSVLQSADCVMAQSHVEADVLQRLGVAGKRIRITGVGIDVARARGGDGGRFRRVQQLGAEPIIAFVGTASIDKGALDLYHAMRHAWGHGAQVRLVFAGHLMPAVATAARSDPRCSCLGVVTEETKLDLLAAATLLVMPSRVESLGLAYLEAWANGLSVIGATVGATAELITHGVSGLLVPFGDPDALASAIELLLRDASLRGRLGIHGRELVESHYTWAQVLPRIVAAYEQTVKHHHEIA